MWIIDTIVKLFKLSYNIFIHFIITINRWIVFLTHLIMMFFVWNSLLVIIGIVQTAQLTIGFGCDVSNLATFLKSPDSNKISIQEEKEEKPLTFWQKRRKVYQEMIDNLYVKYMERLVEIQQEQAKYWQSDNYIYPQSHYNGDDNGETSSDASGGSGDNNHLFIPPIKITEDTSTAF
ncbi:hypothetical protein RhiirB3_526752 [Rhizophagus irregularis]|nr:hypothetical protein RhiirB3_526752 [Rhizophagus irregularis]